MPPVWARAGPANNRGEYDLPLGVITNRRVVAGLAIGRPAG